MSGVFNNLWQLVSTNSFYSILGMLLILFACLSLYWAFNTTKLQHQPGGPLTGLGLGVLLFWAIGPPVWFFLEYHIAASSDRAAIKDSRDLAAQIWAAVLAILVFRLSLK